MQLNNNKQTRKNSLFHESAVNRRGWNAGYVVYLQRALLIFERSLPV